MCIVKPNYICIFPHFLVTCVGIGRFTLGLYALRLDCTPFACLASPVASLSLLGMHSGNRAALGFHGARWMLLLFMQNGIRDICFLGSLQTVLKDLLPAVALSCVILVYRDEVNAQTQNARYLSQNQFIFG